MDGRGVTSYAGLNYKSLVTDPVGGGKIGLRVRGTLKDHTGASVTLKGPLEDNLTGAVNDAVVNASARFYLLKGKSGKVAVKVSTTESNFRFAVIKLK